MIVSGLTAPRSTPARDRPRRARRRASRDRRVASPWEDVARGEPAGSPDVDSIRAERGTHEAVRRATEAPRTAPATSAARASTSSRAGPLVGVVRRAAEHRGARRRRRRSGSRSASMSRSSSARSSTATRSTGRCSGTPGRAEWLPFLAPVTVLVFLQAGLYAPRERRAGAGRILAALVLVALIVLAFGARHRLRLHDDRADPDRRRHVRARDRRPPRGVRLDLARADARSPGSAAGCSSSARARRSPHLERQLQAARGGIGDRRDRDVRARAGPLRRSARDRSSGCVELLERDRPDELVLAEADFDEETVLDVVQLAHRTGRPREARADDDRAARPRGRVRPGRGRAALRAAPADAHAASSG